MRQERERRTVAHLLHYIPEARYREAPMVEEAIPLREVALAVRLPQRPSRVLLAPGASGSGEPLPWVWSEGRAHVAVPEVRGHAMVVFEE